MNVALSPCNVALSPCKVLLCPKNKDVLDITMALLWRYQGDLLWRISRG